MIILVILVEIISTNQKIRMREVRRKYNTNNVIGNKIILVMIKYHASNTNTSNSI